jgi:hypothetical protein
LNFNVVMERVLIYDIGVTEHTIAMTAQMNLNVRSVIVDQTSSNVTTGVALIENYDVTASMTATIDLMKSTVTANQANSSVPMVSALMSDVNVTATRTALISRTNTTARRCLRQPGQGQVVFTSRRHSCAYVKVWTRRSSVTPKDLRPAR